MSVAREHAHTLRLPVVMPSREYCASCVGRLETAVASLPGVKAVEVDRRTSTLTVVHDTALLPEDAIEARVRRLGLDIGAGVAHASWRVTGLD